MSKIVQGVQALVQGVVQGQSLAARGLCRVCSTSLYVTREEQNTDNDQNTKNKTASRVYGCLHTLHTLHRPRISTHHEFSLPAQLPAHPAQPLFY
jgi:hypothetical protein